MELIKSVSGSAIMSRDIFTNLWGIVSIPVALLEFNSLIILLMSSLGAFLNLKVFGSGKLTLISSILGCFYLCQ